MNLSTRKKLVLFYGHFTPSERLTVSCVYEADHMPTGLEIQVKKKISLQETIKLASTPQINNKGRRGLKYFGSRQK